MDSIFFSKVFWGGIVVLIGISIIAQAIFKINIPVFKIGVALILIYLGFKMLIGAFGFSSTNFMSDQQVTVERLNKENTFDVVMGSQRIDLTQIDLMAGAAEVTCNVVMGSSTVILPKNANIEVISSVVLGSVKDPKGHETVLGEQRNRYESVGSNLNLMVKLNVVLGSAEVYYE